MTVPSTPSRNDYIGTGLLDAYDFSFRITSEADLLVTKQDTLGVGTTLTYPTDYTVTGVGDFPGGTITLTAGNLPTGYLLTIRDDPALVQTSDIRNQGDFFPEIHEDAFDYVTRIVKSQQDTLDRAVKLSETTTGVSTELPAPEAGYSIVWNATADGLINAVMASAPTSAFMATVLDDVDAPSARLTLGVPAALDGVHTGTTSVATLSVSGVATLGSATINGNATVGGTALAGNRVLTTINTDAGAASSASILVQTNAGLLQLVVGSTAAGGSASLLSSATGAFAVYSTQAVRVSMGTNNRADDVAINSTGVVSLGGAGAKTGYTTRGDLVLPDARNIYAFNAIKAKVNFTVSGGTPAVQEAHNCTITDLGGLGEFRLNFANAMPSDDYSIAGICKGNGGYCNWVEDHISASRLTTSINIRCVDFTPNSVDPAIASFIVA